MQHQPTHQPDQDSVDLAYSVRDVADRLHVSQRHVQRMVKTGELPSVKLGRRRLIPRTVLVRWLAGAAA
jgi:excisionase family DNA binding protein